MCPGLFLFTLQREKGAENAVISKAECLLIGKFGPDFTCEVSPGKSF